MRTPSQFESESLVSEILAGAQSVVRESAAQLLMPLTVYDCGHGGDLTRTLSIFLTEGCNTSRAAKCLHLHRSGLLYRLARIEQLLQLELDVYEVRVALEVAFLALGHPGTSSR